MATLQKNVGITFHSKGSNKLVGDFSRVAHSSTKLAPGFKVADSVMANYSTSANRVSKENFNISNKTAFLARSMSLLTRDVGVCTRTLQRWGFTALNSSAASSVLAVNANKVNRTFKEVNNTLGVTGKNATQTSFQTAQVAAQFQDVGVTAAMGMHPMMIAMQQGTQLAGQFQMAGKGLGGTLKGLVTGFASMFGPVTLFAIALTGVTAYAIQSVNWSKALSNALMGIAYGLELLSNNITMLMPGFLIITGSYLPTILMQIKGISIMLYARLLPVIVSVFNVLRANPLGLFVTALTAAIGALSKFTSLFSLLNRQIRNLTGMDVGKKINENFVQPLSNASKSVKNAALAWKETSAITEEVTEKILTLREGIEAGFSTFRAQASNVGGAIKTYITSNLNKANSILSDLLVNMVTGSKKSLDSVIDAVKKFGRSLLSEMISIGTKLLASKAVGLILGFLGGGSVIGGLIEGASNLFSGQRNPGSVLLGGQTPSLMTRQASNNTQVNVINNSLHSLDVVSQTVRYDQSGEKIIDMVVEDTGSTNSRIQRSIELNRRF